MQRRFSWAAALALLILVGGVALAASFVETPDPLPSAPGYVMAANLSSADSPTITDTPIRPRSCEGCSKVVIVPTSSVSGATVTFLVVGYFRVSSTTTFAVPLRKETVTFESSSGDNVKYGGRYTSVDGYMVVPTLGCQRYDTRAISISSGNVNWSSYKLGVGTAVAGTSSE